MRQDRKGVGRGSRHRQTETGREVEKERRRETEREGQEGIQRDGDRQRKQASLKEGQGIYSIAYNEIPSVLEVSESDYVARDPRLEFRQVNICPGFTCIRFVW